MFQTVKRFVTDVLIISLFMVAAFLAPHEAHAQRMEAFKESQGKHVKIPVLGKTADGKYPIYKLEGDLQDFNYRSGNYMYSDGNLLGALVFLEKQDVNKGQYQCEYVCKDRKGHIVGMNPSYQSLAHK